jgi:hypothetical protein
MRRGEDPSQKLISVPWCLMKTSPRPLVVAIVGEDASFTIKFIGPVWIGESGRQYDQFKRVKIAAISEPTHVRDIQQTRERIISRIPLPPALIDGVNVEVRGGKT